MRRTALWIRHTTNMIINANGGVSERLMEYYLKINKRDNHLKTVVHTRMLCVKLLKNRMGHQLLAVLSMIQ